MLYMYLYATKHKNLKNVEIKEPIGWLYQSTKTYLVHSWKDFSSLHYWILENGIINRNKIFLSLRQLKQLLKDFHDILKIEKEPYDYEELKETTKLLDVILKIDNIENYEFHYETKHVEEIFPAKAT